MRLQLILLLLLFSPPLVLNAEEESSGQFSPPLFAFQTGFANAASHEPAYLANLVADSGFAGVEIMTLKQAEYFLPHLKKQDLKLYSIYLKIDLQSEQPYDVSLPQFLEQHGKDLHYLWFHIHSAQHPRSDPSGDERCVEVLRELSELVRPYEVKIGIYQHVGLWAERFSDGVRIARKVDRDNVGAVFNLCHYLKTVGPDKLEEELAAAFPHLMLVSINGADDGDTTKMGWDRLIQPLDQGSFDLNRVLKVLADNGYNGPIGLQGYGVSQKPEEFFPRSVKHYRRLLHEVNELENSNIQ